MIGLKKFSEFANLSVFTADILRLEIINNTNLHLTFINLPSLISVSKNEQDVQLVGNLINSYLENSRTIILTVMPASSNIDTQSIIQHAYHFDKNDLKTVKIITKLDLINDGAEPHIIKLANNNNKIKLKLRFFLLKNPKPVKLEKNITIL